MTNSNHTAQSNQIARTVAEVMARPMCDDLVAMEQFARKSAAAAILVLDDLLNQVLNLATVKEIADVLLPERIKVLAALVKLRADIAGFEFDFGGASAATAPANTPPPRIAVIRQRSQEEWEQASAAQFGSGADAPAA